MGDGKKIEQTNASDRLATAGQQDTDKTTQKKAYCNNSPKNSNSLLAKFSINEQSLLNFKNALWGGGEYLLIALLQLIAVPIYIKGIGVEMFGVWVLANTFLGISGILSFGMGQTTLKYVSKYRALGAHEELSHIIRATLTVYMCFSVIGAFLLYFYSGFLVKNIFSISTDNIEIATNALKITSLGLVFYFADMSFDAAIRGYERFDLAVPIHTTMAFLMHIGRILLVISGYGIESILWLTVIIFAIEASTKAWIIRYMLLEEFVPLPIFSITAIKTIWSFGFFSWINNMIVLVRNNGEPMIVGAILGPELLAYYSIARKLIDQILTLVGKIFSFVFPSTSKIYERGDYQLLKKNYNYFCFIALLFGAVVITPLIYVCDPLLVFWVGPETAANVSQIMTILCFAYSTQALGVINGYYLFALGEVRVMSIINCISCVVLLGAMAIGAHFYGLKGAAYSQGAVILFSFVNRLVVEMIVFEKLQMIKTLRLMSAALLPIILAVITPFVFITDNNIIDILIGSILTIIITVPLFIFISEGISGFISIKKALQQNLWVKLGVGRSPSE